MEHICRRAHQKVLLRRIVVARSGTRSVGRLQEKCEAEEKQNMGQVECRQPRGDHALRCAC